MIFLTSILIVIMCRRNKRFIQIIKFYFYFFKVTFKISNGVIALQGKHCLGGVQFGTSDYLLQETGTSQEVVMIISANQFSIKFTLDDMSL